METTTIIETPEAIRRLERDLVVAATKPGVNKAKLPRRCLLPAGAEPEGCVMLCRHAWGFPRRRPEFRGYINVDVQTCGKCGGRRLSPVQFGPECEPAAIAGKIQEVGHEAPSRS